MTENKASYAITLVTITLSLPHTIKITYHHHITASSITVVNHHHQLPTQMALQHNAPLHYIAYFRVLAFNCMRYTSHSKSFPKTLPNPCIPYIQLFCRTITPSPSRPHQLPTKLCTRRHDNTVHHESERTFGT